jgi:NADPH:quinone reductase-like Zn-dependent oxidoreductase
MKAAVINGPGQTPQYATFCEPTAREDEELIFVRASALSHLTKSRASGSHYSSDGHFPAVAGTDGVGRTANGKRVYFVLPEAPFGALAEKSFVKAQHCIPLPDDLDDITAVAIANPGMSAWAAMMERAHLKAGETVLVNGARGTAGRLAVQLAKYFGAAKVIATGRNEDELKEVKAFGADVTISFSLGTPNGIYFPSGFGIHTRRTGCGRYVLLFSSCVSSSSHFCTPYSSMSSNVWPSTPAAPRFALQHS